MPSIEKRNLDLIFDGKKVFSKANLHKSAVLLKQIGCL
jgi:hypothetical protein